MIGPLVYPNAGDAIAVRCPFCGATPYVPCRCDACEGHLLVHAARIRQAAHEGIERSEPPRRRD